VIDASSDLDLQENRTYKERLEGLMQSDSLNNLIQSEDQAKAMSSHAKDGQLQFDFDFEGANFYGYDEEWMLYMVRDFLLRYLKVRGTTLLDFLDELKAKTTYEVDMNKLAKLVQSAETL
jgi:hypothetical protein